MTAAVTLTTNSGYSWTTSVNKDLSCQDILDYFLDSKFDIYPTCHNEERMERVVKVKIVTKGKENGEEFYTTKSFTSQRFLESQDKAQKALEESVAKFSRVYVTLGKHDGIVKGIIATNDCGDWFMGSHRDRTVDIDWSRMKKVGLPENLIFLFSTYKSLELLVRKGDSFDVVFSYDW